VSVKFDLEDGKSKKYETYWTIPGSDGYIPDRPYITKCGLSFEKEPKDGACGHLECAIDAARKEALYLAELLCVLSPMYIVFMWYDKRDLLAAVLDAVGFFIMFVPFIILLSVFPIKRWLELREYRDRGTIHRRRARRL
jgi:hypothetical protein